MLTISDKLSRCMWILSVRFVQSMFWRMLPPTKQCASPMNCPFPNLTEDYPNPYHVQNIGSKSTKRMKLRCVDLFAWLLISSANRRSFHHLSSFVPLLATHNTGDSSRDLGVTVGMGPHLHHLVASGHQELSQSWDDGIRCESFPWLPYGYGMRSSHNGVKFTPCEADFHPLWGWFFTPCEADSLPARLIHSLRGWFTPWFFLIHLSVCLSVCLFAGLSSVDSRR